MKKFVICFLILFACAFTEVTSVDASSHFADTNSSFVLTGAIRLDAPDIDVTDYNRDDSFDTNCEDFAKTIQMGGKLLFLVKIVLPIVLIALGTINFGKIAMTGDPGEFKKQGKKLGISLVGAILIFFLPTLVYTVFSFINGFEENRTSDSKICFACIFDPYSSDCTNYIK